MNREVVWAVAAKDMRAVTANVQVWLPMAIVPVMLGVVLPAVLIGVILYAGGQAGDEVQQIQRLLDSLPAGALRLHLATLPALELRLAYLAANYMLAPLFLLVPLIASSVLTASPAKRSGAHWKACFSARPTCSAS